MRRIGVCLLLASACLGQEFEVVSIKPNKSGSGDFGSNGDQGRFTTNNMSLKTLIMMAYGVRNYQVEGPEWLGSERFDIAAKLPGELPKDPEKSKAAFQTMMQKMLSERFKLTVHHDTKSFAVYGLFVGKNGIKFKEVPNTGSQSKSKNNHYSGGSVSMAGFAGFLSGRMDLPVVDMTGLKGAYDLTLDWVPESRQGDGSTTPAGPILRDALQDQLGLRLEHRKTPIDILIVDHAERIPTEN
jgi:uncharacterized protein (TIGR03435 family)